MESKSAIGSVSFADLFRRLLVLINKRIQNGEFSERKLARLIGISQPQMHNVLKGARGLSPEIADRLLGGLHLSLFDLMTSNEKQAQDLRLRPVDLPVERLSQSGREQQTASVAGVRKAIRSAHLEAKKAAS